MVKLVFNPKNEKGVSTISSRTSKCTSVIEKNMLKPCNLKPFQDTFVETNEIIAKNNELLCKNLVGLENCHYVLKEWFYDKTKKNMLLIGPTGCGKSTLVDLFCKEEDIRLLNIKSIDNKTKRDVLKDISLFMEYSGDFFVKNKKMRLLLIDDYQNGPNDIFNITDLTTFNFDLKILVIASDSKGSKLSDLKRVFETYYINEIPSLLIKNWIISLKQNLTTKQVEDLVKNCKSDKRLILNTLQFFNKDDFYCYKDEEINLFEFIKQVFNDLEPLDINTYFKSYDNDGYLLANLVHENYLDYNQDIHSIANAAESISCGEIFFSDTYESNKSFLPDIHCLNSIIIPSYYSRSKTNFKSFPRSSIINNRFNILLNNKKILQKINGLKVILDIYDVYTIKKILNQELIKGKTSNVEHKIEFIKNVLVTLNNELDRLELIYKHFNEFKEITGKEVKTKNFTLKFKEKLK